VTIFIALLMPFVVTLAFLGIWYAFAFGLRALGVALYRVGTAMGAHWPKL
jgi:hypothetical protein